MNPSTALATVIVERLVAHGVRHAVLAPGSRSAPLAYALASAAEAGRIDLHVRIDERSAGFLALGLAKAGGPPAVVVTTSGTAVVNLHPAVLEAAHAGVPLLVLSADRPHELRGVGANQTTDQVKVFGAAVRSFAEIPAPAQPAPAEPAAVRERGWRAVVDRALVAARGTRTRTPGPVHVNVAFRDPLVPDADLPDADLPDADLPDADLPDAGPPASGAEPLPAPPLVVQSARPRDVVPHLLEDGPRTVVVAGDDAGWEARWLADAGGWPLLAEPGSQARSGPNAIPVYRLLLRRPDLGGRVDRVVVLGRPTLSRPVQALLARPGVEVVVVIDDRTDWPDPAGTAAQVVSLALPARLRDTWEQHGAKGWFVAVEDDWLRAWRSAGARLAAALDALLDGEAAQGRLTGPLVARETAAALAPGQVLVAGASNPIRDLDLAMRAPDETVAGLGPGTRGVFPESLRRVLANRGLAGIDGTVSTASGVALALQQRPDRPGPVRALVGDLTFLHDAGGLLVGPRERRPHLQVVVVDDGGGGIFRSLEHGERAGRGAAEAVVFERVFGTPHGADLEALCAGYAVAYRRATTAAELRAALARPPAGTSVLHMPIDPDRRRLDALISGLTSPSEPF